MSRALEEFIRSVCVETAVYWEPDECDGYGQKKFKNPVEIECRWDDQLEMVLDAQGKEVLSRGRLMLVKELKPEGMLRYGTLEDIEEEFGISEAKDKNPLDIGDAFEIVRVDRTPMFRSTDRFVRTAWLMPSQRGG